MLVLGRGLALLVLQLSFFFSVAQIICNNGDVRLADGVSNIEGRVEFCNNGVWGTICHHQWGPSDAKVVCRQLGLPTTHADALYAYGGGEGGIFFSHIQCTGNESRLEYCIGNIAVNCSHDQDAGVKCADVPCTEDDVRLNGYIVQVCHNSQWGFVCASVTSWNFFATRVVCKQIGMPSTDPRWRHLSVSYVDGPVILNDVTCTGSPQQNLTDCTHNGYGLFPQCSNVAYAICEALVPCNETNTIRLTLGTSVTIGRLEVCSGGYWKSVCGVGTTNATATVACRQLNHAHQGQVFFEDHFGLVINNVVPIALTSIVCGGNESSLSECTFTEYADGHSCTHQNDIIIECGVCNETDVRLVDGRTPYDGRVEICLLGRWGAVCDDKWDYREATVLCRQLGYNGPSYALNEHSSNDTGTLIFLDDVSCYGNESKLSECQHRGLGIENCISGTDEAGVICTDMTCEDGAVYLVGGDTLSRGRVEYCYHGSWYSLCANNWGEQEARVVCNTLGYDTTAHVSVVSNFGRGTSPILNKNIQCSSGYNDLSQCIITEQDTNQCQHVAGVICEAPCLSSGCEDCDDIDNCGYIPSDICYCTSSCYEIGLCCPDIFHVENCFNMECETGQVRLVGGVTGASGRLEVCANGVWGNVCNFRDDWGPDNAGVVCRQLGFSSVGSYPVPTTVFGPGSERVVLGEVHCIGTESGLLECSHNSVGDHICGLLNLVLGISEHTFDVAISCYDEEKSCEDGDVRLQDGTDISNGRVEFCQYQTWGAVCNDMWDHDDAVVVCRQLGYDQRDAKAMQLFGAGEVGPVFLSEVECIGTEVTLTACPKVGIGNHSCSLENTAAGVACGKINVSRCKDESGTPSMKFKSVLDDERFGICEAYTGSVEVCEGVLTAGINFVYITKEYLTQKNISEILNNTIQRSLFIKHDKDCVDQVFRVICWYFLPPCGTIVKRLPPSSVCQKECSHVQSSCQETWGLVKDTFGSSPFINCEDTSDLLFPIPNCCTGAGIQISEDNNPSPTPTGRSNTSKDSPGGAIAGAVTGTVIFIVAVAIVVVLVFVILTHHVNKKKQVDRMQMDILAMPGSNPVYTSQINDTLRVNPVATHEEMEPDDKNDFFMSGASAAPNPYCVPRPSTNSRVSETSLLGVSGGANRTRLNSRYLRELSQGHFLIKYEHITQLENIGQGEFGIVYKARLNLHGKSGREVAVKTLKGTFDQIEVDKFVEESLKMSRFKHAHVMGLIGVCLDGGSAPYIIMPYMANGSLLKYLKRERENIVLSENADEDEVLEVRKRLMVMCSQIASGMEYLAQEKYVHRDLATRNCMIDSHFLIKITDFGLSEDVFVRNYFRQGSEGEVVKLPIKWMAPESLSDGHFSEKSDVWSYGVTMWEIFSGGKAPFPGTDPLTLMQRLEEGHRMGKPTNAACAEEIYVMMRKCWETSPRDRPTFKELHSNTSKYTERIAGYLDLGFNPFNFKKRVEEDEVEERGFESPVAIQVIPASVETNLAHTTFTNTQH